MKVFGRHKSALDKVNTPIGETCGWCKEKVIEGDEGVLIPHISLPSEAVFHSECYIRMIMGGANHQLGLCSCCGGMEPPDPENLSSREAAKEAYRIYKIKNNNFHHEEKERDA